MPTPSLWRAEFPMKCTARQELVRCRACFKLDVVCFWRLDILFCLNCLNGFSAWLVGSSLCKYRPVAFIGRYCVFIRCFFLVACQGSCSGAMTDGKKWRKVVSFKEKWICPATSIQKEGARMVKMVNAVEEYWVIFKMKHQAAGGFTALNSLKVGSSLKCVGEGLDARILTRKMK